MADRILSVDSTTKLPPSSVLAALGAALGSGGGGSNGLNVADVGYDIVITAGQSNMSGSGGSTPISPSTYDYTSPRIMQWAASGPDVGNIVLGSDPTLNPPADISGGVGPAMQFAREWIKRVPVNRSVLLVNTAVGATGLVGSSWAVGNSNYLQTIGLANAAIAAAGSNSRVVAILWCQGEADSVTNRTQAQYATAFDAMIAGWRSAITGAANAPVVVGSMVPEWRNVPSGTSLQIHAAHVATPSRISNAYFVDGPTGMHEGEGSPNNGIHYTPKGARLLGRYMAEAIWSSPAAPSAVTGVTASGGVGQVALAWNGTPANPAPTGYIVEHKLSSGSAWTSASIGAVTSHSVTGLTNGSSYDFRVSAVNPIGTGPVSVVVTATPAPSAAPVPSYLIDARTLALADGATLPSWLDTSSNTAAPDVSQGTTASQPAYRATGLAGGPSVQFDGTDDSLGVTAPGSSVIGANGEFTVVAVFSVANHAANRTIVGFRDDTGGVFHFIVDNTGFVDSNALNGSVFGNRSASAVTLNTPTLAVLVRGATTVRVYKDGVAGPLATSAAPATVPGNFPFTIGRTSNSLWRHNGHIAYVAIYPKALTDAERVAVETELMADFGIG